MNDHYVSVSLIRFTWEIKSDYKGKTGVEIMCHEDAKDAVTIKHMLTHT